MEGNIPTGCMVLVKYVQLKSSMEDRLKDMHLNNPLYPMVNIMLEKINLYLEEALACDTLVLTAVFHPGLRVQFFSRAFGEGSPEHDRAKALLEVAFTSECERQAAETQESDKYELVTTSSVQDSPPSIFSPSFLLLSSICTMMFQPKITSTSSTDTSKELIR